MDDTEVMLVKWAFMLWVMLKGLFLGDPSPCPCSPSSSLRISDVYLLLLLSLLLFSLSLDDLTDSLLRFDLIIHEDTPLEEEEEEEEGVPLLGAVVKLPVEGAVEAVVAPESVAIGAVVDPALITLVLFEDEVTADDEEDV